MEHGHDLELIIRSRVPIVVIESHEERRALDMLRPMATRLALPLFMWKITEGLRRLDLDYPPQRYNIEPPAVLGHIKSTRQAGVYVLLDFHPYLTEPVNVRLLKDIALGYEQTPRTVVLLSGNINLPAELKRFSARFDLALPGPDDLKHLVQGVANEWAAGNGGRRVKADPRAFELLIRNLAGLTSSDARRLARNVIYDDGAITADDLPTVMSAKYQLLDKGGVLSFEYDTARFSDVGGQQRLKRWLEQRKSVFNSTRAVPGLDPPKGILLLGVQGCGKSLAAKAVAGIFGVPLLRLDFGALYNKYYGETERNLREALKTAEVMAPCTLWMDELEKGLATQDSDDGVSRRVLGALLTWMAERRAQIFLVATANDIAALPPELVRKGRFDEIFFVDLPRAEIRERIFAIHLAKRELDPAEFDLEALAAGSEGFSGAEIEQAIVSALYTTHAAEQRLSTEQILAEIDQTRPLSVVMAEHIAALRDWAAGRTVPSD
jgi:AAA+ superfamily predicted ATPase